MLAECCLQRKKVAVGRSWQGMGMGRSPPLGRYRCSLSLHHYRGLVISAVSSEGLLLDLDMIIASLRASC